MWSYILEVHICWLVLYAFYVASLSKETYYHANRWYLLTAFMLGLFIPFIKFSQIGVESLSSSLTAQLPVIDITAAGTWIQANFNLTETLWLLYWAGVAFGLFRLFLGVMGIWKLYSQGELERSRGFTTVYLDEPIEPFSFFQCLFVHKNHQLNDKEWNTLLQHEITHIRHWHSLDRMVIDIIAIFFWFSPMVWMFKKSLKDVHEFEADAHVLRSSALMDYGQLLLKYANQPLQKSIKIGNAFFGTQLKRRFIMMTKRPSNEISLLKYLLALPILMLMFFALSCKDAIEDQLGIEKPQNVDKELIVDYDAEALKEDEKNKDLFVRVDQMPQFPGGERALVEFIQKSIEYPQEAMVAELEGIAVVQFNVNEDGTLSEAEIARDLGMGCGEEALRVVKSMPDWIPGKQNGKSVKVKFTLPVRFKLK
ncbi:MAG: M56 family metallopeptidase [Saprospiraceae bacterium]|nr:M56 family metallopeptidase [Saprospiraceae bacterium]